jgi:hypothetical protein
MQCYTPPSPPSPNKHTGRGGAPSNDTTLTETNIPGKKRVRFRSEVAGVAYSRRWCRYNRVKTIGGAEGPTTARFSTAGQGNKGQVQKQRVKVSLSKQSHLNLDHETRPSDQHKALRQPQYRASGPYHQGGWQRSKKQWEREVAFLASQV